MSWQQLRRRLAMTKQQKQAAQLSRRDHVTQYVSWNPVKCCTAVVKISLEKACSRWQMSLDTGITAILKAIYHFQYWSIVKTTPSGTVCEILPCLQCSWLPMTLRSPAFKKKTVEITNTNHVHFFIHVYRYRREDILHFRRYGCQKGFKQQSNNQGQSRSPVTVLYHTIGHIQFPISLPLQLCLDHAPFLRYYHQFPNIEKVTRLWTHPLWYAMQKRRQSGSSVSPGARSCIVRLRNTRW